MKLIIDDKEKGWVLDDYLEYLEEIKDELPENTRNFAFSPGHYDIKHRQCPHDSWVETVAIKELAEGKRKEVRTLQINARFLGPYHDGHFDLTYHGVKSYQLDLERSVRKEAKIGHGDWIIDEILLEDSGLISHEIVFSDSGHWKVICEDISYAWLPKVN